MTVTLLAKSGGIGMPAIGVGCWSWGDDKGVWGWNAYDRSLSTSSIAGAFHSSLQNNLRLFDTAETYGSGLSEKIVGDLLRATPENFRNEMVIATKFQPGKWSKSRVRPAMLRAARESCQRLGVKQIDLYQIHAPLHGDSLTDQGLGLADVVDAGLARAVGVSNFSLEEMRQVHAALATRGIPLATNQVEYSILRQLPETSGLKAGCEALGVKVLAYSPLAMGRLTGKYSARNEPKGNRGFGAVPMSQLEPLIEKLRQIAQRCGCTPGQVALAWVIAKGAIPIAGAKNSEQAVQNAGALRCQLMPHEIEV